MSNRSNVFLSGLLSLILVSCGSNKTPELDATQISNTAIANAWTALAATQAALPSPTDTPFPPTLTPPPTFTRQPVITLAAMTLNSPVPVGNPTENPCYLPFPPFPQGGVVTATFINESGGSVALSFGMEEQNSFGECGSGSENLGIFDEASVKILAGCYWAFGYVSGPETSTAKNINPLCMTTAGTEYELTVGTEVIGFK
jgi:hypothetical protein